MSLEERMDNEDHCATEQVDFYSWMDPVQGSNIRGDKKKRFSQEQIKSLESMFENQTKLEPRQKLQLAKELGLQPRQVAIWFQNKRARWKSKQLERQYSSLRKDYDALRSSFESLKKEKQDLIKQLQNLSEQLELPTDDDSNEVDPNSTKNPKVLQSLKEEPGPNPRTSSDNEDKNFNYLGEPETNLYDCHLTSSLISSAPPQFCLQNSWTSDISSANSHCWGYWPLNK